MNPLLQISAELRDAVNQLVFPPPVTNIYNPLNYAWHPHSLYLEKYGTGIKKVILLGMNPGPYGMAQTGIPFGDIVMVRDWMNITGNVSKPENEHPKRIIDGFKCNRREGSGKRLWGWAEQRFTTADIFFQSFFVLNYCPLIFFNDDGVNITPDKLSKSIQIKLNEICDSAILKTITVLKPEFVIGIGNFATDRLRNIVSDDAIIIDSIIHPSPANPLANKGWSEQVDIKLRNIGIL